MKEFILDGGKKESCKKKLLKSRLKWAAHVERIGYRKVAQRADAQSVEGK